MTIQENDTSKQFTIYENYPLFIPYLYSAWRVERTSTYTAAKVRTQEPLHLRCFIRTLSGKGIIQTTDESFVVPPNSLVLLDVQKIVQYAPVKDKWIYFWYNFTSETPPPFFQPNKIYSIDKMYMEQEINEEMFSLMQSYEDTNIMLTTSIFCELVCRWAKYCKDEINNTIPYYSVVKDILFFINNNIQLNFSIHSLAEKCFLSERQFREVFRQFTGVSPKQYICQQKLKRIAMTLITTPVTINALAADFNYSSPFQLSRDFKKYFGVSPKEYRSKTSNGGGGGGVHVEIQRDSTPQNFSLDEQKI